MLAPDIGSTNADTESSAESPRNVRSREKAPLLSKNRFFSGLQNILGMSGSSSSANVGGDGYIEFGVMNPDPSRTLGTFAGVFSPVALSMFSALLFLRVGFIVGNAGLLMTLLQFLIAYKILVFTVASICAISTNGAVEGGGAYFMISRTLGPEFGGAIGTLFFFANVVSSALYITGCTEGIMQNFGPSGYMVGENGGLLPDGTWWRFLYCTVLNILNLGVCLIGAGMFAKTSAIILATVCVCILSTLVSFFVMDPMEVALPDSNHLVQNETFRINGTFTGLNFNTLKSNTWPHFGRDYTTPSGDWTQFASVFGVLFSGVTGIMAGANMSGELKEPARSIPRGTLSAVAFTFVVYLALAVLTAASCNSFLLQNNYLFMMPINVWPPFVVIGILTATFSASLSNLIGSSRVLEALAKDNVFGVLLKFVSRGVWSGNPIMAVFLSWALVEGILLIGSLNLIAQINSVLFLLSYLATNMACLGLELASAPNFRPSFKWFSWHTALIGLLGTIVMMFVINPIYASSSILLCLLLFLMLHFFSPSRNVDWGSISQALIFHQVRKYLLMLDSRKDHVKFWRPQMLLLVNNPRAACPLIHFINDLKKGGLYVLGHVKVGDFTTLDADPTLEEYTHWLSIVDHLKVKAFIELTVAPSIREGLQHLIRLSGMGAMKPNTIVLGFYDEEEPVDFFERTQSRYKTRDFDNVSVSSSTSGKLFELRTREHQPRFIDQQQYVGMINDVLKLRKNLCICRHFHKLDKMAVTKTGQFKHIDVWPINLFTPDDDDPFDTSSLFMLQLACILNMVPGWKHLNLRVYLLECGNQRRNNEHRLRQLLQQLRITASIYQVDGWTEKLQCLQRSGGTVLPTAMDNFTSKQESQDYISSVNEMIRKQSQQTAALFIYLPPPPAVAPGHADYSMLQAEYLDLVTKLTNDLPPTVFVYGVSAVTSTTL
ncbi:solute carrier family 12 member 9 [Frankliniella occidentalis]|uniref:Solute carrier family 12 member 9 n=1 Tax=Frankliniella occidentalis TaxID=133901 RepID=A0A6J1SWK4_FRAOC|nr:solute carrier family 12 member 9 [Frankliniella occidentalis]